MDCQSSSSYWLFTVHHLDILHINQIICNANGSSITKNRCMWTVYSPICILGLFTVQTTQQPFWNVDSSVWTANSPYKLDGWQSIVLTVVDTLYGINYNNNNNMLFWQFWLYFHGCTDVYYTCLCVKDVFALIGWYQWCHCRECSHLGIPQAGSQYALYSWSICFLRSIYLFAEGPWPVMD